MRTSATPWRGTRTTWQGTPVCYHPGFFTGSAGVGWGVGVPWYIVSREGPRAFGGPMGLWNSRGEVRARYRRRWARSWGGKGAGGEGGRKRRLGGRKRDKRRERGGRGGVSGRPSVAVGSARGTEKTGGWGRPIANEAIRADGFAPHPKQLFRHWSGSGIKLIGQVAWPKATTGSWQVPIR